MIIAYRGNFRHPWCTEVHVALSLEQLGHVVLRLQEDQSPWSVCVETAKRAHLFLWTKTWMIEPDEGHAALGELRDAGVPSVSFHLDRYIGLDREAQIAEDPFWRTDFVFTADGGNQPKFEAYGVNHRWLPPGVFGPECRNGRPSRKFPHPVVFVGSHPYPHAEWRPYRDELIARFRERFGSDFAVWPRGRPVRNKELSDLYASAKVVVGDSCLIGNPSCYWSDRIPETLGRGGALIHPEVAGLEHWYEDGVDLATYPVGDFGAAVEAAEFLLAADDARESIRRHGQETVLGRDTYEHRLQSVLEVVAREHGFGEPAPANETVTVRTHYFRRGAALEVRPGHPTDRQVIDEVWTQSQYSIEPGDVRGKVVVDVGANIGAFSVLAAALGAREVHAFEPEPGNADLLRRNAASWPAVIVHEAAISGDSGHANLLRGPHDTHGGGSHLERPGRSSADSGDVVVTLSPADALPDGPIGLLKVDCEGGEYEIFAAMGDAELSRVERIRMEFHGPGMPHLAELDADGRHLERWGQLVAKLADYGTVEIHGHPRVGGIIRWKRY